MHNSYVALTISIALITPPLARAGDNFDYKLYLTPEEGPVDPVVQKRYSAEFVDCQRRAHITSENAACFAAEFDRQDSVLNATWKIAFRRTQASMRDALLSNQRQWLAERDPFCRSDAEGFRGGTIAPIVYVNCRVELTIRRTIWLEQRH